jgi:hypothetical protein
MQQARSNWTVKTEYYSILSFVTHTVYLSNWIIRRRRLMNGRLLHLHFSYCVHVLWTKYVGFKNVCQVLVGSFQRMIPLLDKTAFVAIKTILLSDVVGSTRFWKLITPLLFYISQLSILVRPMDNNVNYCTHSKLGAHLIWWFVLKHCHYLQDEMITY